MSVNIGYLAHGAARQVVLSTARFDPKAVQGAVDAGLLPPAPHDSRGLVVLQARGPWRAEYARAINGTGAKVATYLPDDSVAVVLGDTERETLLALPFVRALTTFRPEWKRSPDLERRLNGRDWVKVTISLTGAAAANNLTARLMLRRAKQVRRGTDVIVAEVSPGTISWLSERPEVTYLDHTGVAENDLDNARSQGGAVYVGQRFDKLQGEGLKVHILEGIHADHPAFGATPARQKPIAIGDPKPSSHGTATAGCVLGNDPAESRATGLVPHAQALYTNYDHVMDEPPGAETPNSRWGLTRSLKADHDIDSQTASWGYSRTRTYNERSREMDQILNDQDLVVTQSQSNAGNAASRPQAWAKNVIPVTALYHFDTADTADDRWNRGSSTREGEDGRIGRTLSAYYDKIFTTSSRGYQTGFGGTSGATPIVNGFMNNVIQMFKEGHLKTALRDPSLFADGDRPRAATAAALAIASAEQHPFSGRGAENNRTRQGWGFPNIRSLFDARERLFIVNEDDPVAVDGERVYSLEVADGQPELKISMVYKDPPAAAAAGKAIVNDLDLEVLDPNGNLYRGNHGLMEGNYSKVGGTPDRTDTVENVFVQSPQPGRWTVRVKAHRLAEVQGGSAPGTSHFALVALGAKQAK